MKARPEIPCEREHEFILVLDGIIDLSSEVMDALFEAGCDDATVSIRNGRAFLDFSRSAPTLKDAMLSAIRDVNKARLGVGVLRVDHCNLVTQSEIARKIGRTRQLIRQYITGERGPGGFPAPACDITEGASLWYWCEVAHWLWQNNMVKEDVAREAQDTATINTVLELVYFKALNPELIEEAFCLFSESRESTPV